MAVLIVAEHNNTTVQNATLNAVTAAVKIDTKVHLLLVGKLSNELISTASKIDKVSKLLVANHPEYEHQLAENLADLVVEIGSNYSHIIAAATTAGKNFMPRVAALLGVAQVSDVISIESEDTFKRPIYAGNAIATIQSLDPIKVMTIRTTAFDACSELGGAADIEHLDIVYRSTNSEFVSEDISESERPNLLSASVVVSGGRGMGSKDNFALLESVADKLGAAVGASRAAVDAGFAANDMQVGQTGKIVAPELYIAVGLSGAIQHLAGMKDSKVIVAINKDEEAPIFSVADYGLVGDLFDLLPELEEKL